MMSMLSLYTDACSSLPTLKSAAEIFPSLLSFTSTPCLPRHFISCRHGKCVKSLAFDSKKRNNKLIIFLLGSPHRLPSRGNRSPRLRPRLRRSLQASPSIWQIRCPEEGIWRFSHHLQPHSR